LYSTDIDSTGLLLNVNRDVGNTGRFLIHVRRFDSRGRATKTGVAFNPRVGRQILDQEDGTAQVDWDRNLEVLIGQNRVHMLRTFNGDSRGIVVTDDAYRRIVAVLRELFSERGVLHGR